MPATAILLPPPGFHQVLIHQSTHSPAAVDGEKPIGDILRRWNVPHIHEGRWYPLVYKLPNGSWRTGGFCPDYYLPATDVRPALNIEVTFADHHWPTSSRAGIRANRERIQVKRTKMELTVEHYGVETILITRAVFQRIMRDEKHLDRLIRQAVRRHYRHERKKATA